MCPWRCPRRLPFSSGETSVRLVLPLAGVVLAEVPEARLEDVLGRAAELDWVLFVEQATPEQKVGIDVFGSPPAALPLMRALKERFDPEGILSPGRFVGGI